MCVNNLRLSKWYKFVLVYFHQCSQNPQPLEPSNEIINQQCYRSGSIACQADLVSQRTIGTENCLHLSVYTLDIKPDTLKPCMVWIHGGAFILGSNSKDFYNPEFLLRKDIVLFAINYRLGAFGEHNRTFCEFNFLIQHFFFLKKS